MTTKEQLFADLEKIGYTIDANTITKAKNEDGNAMFDIGWECDKKEQYDKAMAWYRMAADKKNSSAQYNIGDLYERGQGVPRDYLIAFEWFLKSAIQNNKDAWRHIGWLFKKGQGVPFNKYKALEWYYQCGEDSYHFRELTKQGYQLTQQDKNKSIDQLIMETEDVAWPGKRYIRENKLKEEISTLKQLTKKMEEESISRNSEINSLKEEVQSLRIVSEHQQQKINTHLESIDQYKKKEQTINNDVQSLKHTVDTLELKLETDLYELNQA